MVKYREVLIAFHEPFKADGGKDVATIKLNVNSLSLQNCTTCRSEIANAGSWVLSVNK
jgi:hypothetical protein